MVVGTCETELTGTGVICFRLYIDPGVNNDRNANQTSDLTNYVVCVIRHQTEKKMQYLQPIALVDLNLAGCRLVRNYSRTTRVSFLSYLYTT